MRKLVIVSIFLVLLASMVAAEDLLLGEFFPCTTNLECQELCSDTNETCYCHDSLQCALQDGEEVTLNITGTTTILEERLSFLETLQLYALDELETLGNDSTTSSQRLTAIEEQIALVQQQLVVSDLAQEEQQAAVDAVATGLAVLQEEVGETKATLAGVSEELTKEQKRSRALLIVVLALIVFLVALLLSFFITGKRVKRKVHPEIASYITQHIQQGKKYEHIRNSLVDAGWSDGDVQWAYKETMKQNYHNYKKNSSSSLDQRKVVAISVVSVLLLVAIILFVRGVSTGNAAYFNSVDSLDSAVSNHLRTSFSETPFYAALNQGTFCVQVVDGNQQVSYAIAKTEKGHVQRPAPRPCDADQRYDVAIKFLNWQSFAAVAETPTCEMFEKLNGRRKNMVILPSQLVLPGFTLNPAEDISPYCAALDLCLSPLEQARVGC